ncbi:hypothetical protein Tco_0712638 [Tanacetum coccineum]
MMITRRFWGSQQDWKQIVTGGMASKLFTGSLSPLWCGDGEGESDDSELEGVGVGRRGLFPSCLIQKTLFSDRGIITEAYGIFSKDDLLLHKIGIQFGEEHLEGIESDVYSFDLTGLAERSLVEQSVHINSLAKNAKNSGEFLKTESDFKIINDEGDGDGSIQITNGTDTFVQLKNEHGANILVHVGKIVESNGYESGAKVRLVSKIPGFAGFIGQREPALLPEGTG